MSLIAAAATTQPRAVVAERITNGPYRPIKPGTRVPRRELAGPRTFADARHGFAPGLRPGGELVLAVVAGDGKLVAVAQQASNDSGSLRSVTWVYASTDGGKTWRATSLLGG